jgi:hypothetical protein
MVVVGVELEGLVRPVGISGLCLVRHVQGVVRYIVKVTMKN